MTRQATAMKKHELAESFMRETILAAAKRLLAAHGYDRVSLDQIAQEAQVSKGSIYVYFSSKEALLWEVLQSGMRRFIAVAQTAATQEPTPVAQLRVVVHTHLESFAADPDLFKIALTERAGLILNPRSERTQTLWDIYQEHVDWIAEVLRQAIRAKAMRLVPTRRYALVLLDLLFMATYQRVVSPTTIPLDQEAADIMALFLRGVGADAQPSGKKVK